MTNPIKIILANDLEFFRDGFRLMLQKQKLKEIELVAEATNGIELIEKVKKYEPHVVLTDIKMSGIGGIEATKLIKKNYPKMGIIFLTKFEEENGFIDMLWVDAIGYLLKDSSKEEVIEAIKKVAGGSSYFCRSISNKLFQTLSERRYNLYKKKKVDFSFQEIKVMKLICKQLTTKEIAGRLCLCTRTVEDYRRQILEKIGAKNVVGIVLHAIKNNIITMSELESSMLQAN